MKKTISQIVSDRILILDGAMGTMIQQYNLTEEDFRGERFAHIPGQLKGNNDLLCLTRPDVIQDIHRKYLEAGADIIETNTFSSTTVSMADYHVEEYVREINLAAVKLARELADEYTAKNPDKPRFVAGSVGPTNKTCSMSPDVNNPAYRALTYDELAAAYQQQMEAMLEGGVDAILIETIFDTLNAKTAIFAAEQAMKVTGVEVPVMLSVTVSDVGGRTLSGQTLDAFLASVQHANIFSVGLNCSFGARQLKPFLEQLAVRAPYYISAYPNAGLPNSLGKYDQTPADMAHEVKEYIQEGLINIIGGCCGTTPEFIKCLSDMLHKEGNLAKEPVKMPSAVCSATSTVIVDQPRVVGERINPTGKKVFKQALLDNDMDYILGQALEQTGAGADILDVNVGLPGIDERQMMVDTVKALQSVVDVPLQLDSTIPEVLDAALRVYNGKPIVNSVNGEEDSLNNILPIVKKYGAAVIGLALDKDGIPKKAEDRVAIARKIMDRAIAIGIPKEDIYIDCLTLTASAEQEGVMETLNALYEVKHTLGLRTVLGVSNISFGLPNRVLVNHIFLTMAMQNGLDLAIINPNIYEMMGAVRAYKLLANIDKNSVDYIKAYASMPNISKINPMNTAANAVQGGQTAQAGGSVNLKDKKGSYTCDDLFYAVEKGLKNEGAAITEELLAGMDSMDIVNNALIPALDKIGEEFEKGTLFLPQLIMAAGVAQGAFEVIRKHMIMSNNAPVSKGKIVIATVKGDVHDIGKNIVKVLLENYGYEVIDLGKDVEYQVVVDAIKENGAKLCGLSALMTTTLVSMKKTIELIHKNNLDCKVMVGGAVLTPEYAKEIHADFYSKDAKESVDIAKRVLG